MLYCYTSLAVCGTQAQNSSILHSLGHSSGKSPVLCRFCFHEISGSQIVTMFRIARFSLTVFCNIQYVYCAKVGTEYLDDIHLPKCAVYNHCTHNALCLTLFPEKQSNTRCILIYLQMLQYICIHISCTFNLLHFYTNLNLKKSKFVLFIWQFSFANCHILLLNKHSILNIASCKHLMNLQCPLGDVGTRVVHVWTPDRMRLLCVSGHLYDLLPEFEVSSILISFAVQFFSEAGRRLSALR